MDASGRIETCVFCDRPIGPDESRVGRGEAAAHAACADAALADERGWDRIAEALGDDAPAPAAGAGADGATGPGTGGGSAPATAPARAGCATLAVLALVVGLTLTRAGR